MQALDDLSREYSAYMTTVNRFIKEQKENFPALEELKTKLDNVLEEFGVDVVELGEEGDLVGRVFRKEK